MAPSNSVKILELRQVAPACSSTDQSNTELTLPLTFMDALWLKFPPAESIFFYELTESSPTVFISIILPKLITSLSRALVSFLPLAGNLIWPQDSPRPVILYTPNDAVSLTIAESSADFGRLSSNEIREAIESHPYIPELCISDTKASVLALQITLFPNKGFCISFVTHHAVLDGKTTAVFIKAWAHICKHLELGKIDQPPSLPDELIPSFDRSVIKDVAGLETAHLNYWLEMNEVVLKSNPRSLKVLPNIGGPEPSDLVRATFELSREDIKFLRKKVQSQFDSILKEERNETKQLHLSTFVLTCAYTLASMMKARGGDGIKKVFFLFSVDLRSRSLDPPIPNNYFGNCIGSQHVVAEARIFMEENGLAMIAEKFSEIIKGMETRGLFVGAKERLAELASLEPGTQCLGVAGSTRFDFYRSDFGWGEPEKVEIASIDRTNSVSLVESRDRKTGGVEIGLVLKRHEMETFASLLLDMSLDDLIRKGKENGGRDSNFRGRRAGSGSVLGPGPDRWVFRRDSVRPQPYSVRPVKLMQVQQEPIMLAASEGSNGEGKLYISNLDDGVSNEDIKVLFSEVGELLRCSLHYDMSGRSKGTAEVVFARQTDALAAIRRYNNVQLDGKPLKIELVGVNVITTVPVPVPVSAITNVAKPNGAFRRGQGQVRHRVEKLTAEALDSDLDKYHFEAMKLNIEKLETTAPNLLTFIRPLHSTGSSSHWYIEGGTSCLRSMIIQKILFTRGSVMCSFATVFEDALQENISVQILQHR
ncbi:hypothetical protein SADUNF_Sadunf10G0161500 [Salix dunnii]|uniref:RRM domain-containing protein n=1 Tax=Salix dunnii TaxID=1413687 RepID=A0A835JWE0_9ROSI|nr:hypothetical protein SADUNF_Sadunf10G0161500 [Salix dunnii]